MRFSSWRFLGSLALDLEAFPVEPSTGPHEIGNKIQGSIWTWLSSQSRADKGEMPSEAQ